MKWKVRGYNYAGVAPEAMEKRMNAYRPWMEKMTQAGRYKSGGPLEPGTGRLLKDKKTVLTDGPFLESKEKSAFFPGGTGVPEVIGTSFRFNRAIGSGVVNLQVLQGKHNYSRPLSF